MNKSSLERNGWNWAAVPADVILNENLTHADVRVYAYLLWRSGKKEHSWPNVQTIADDLHMGYSTARLCLSHLVKQGWINRKRQMMRSSVTFINEIPFPRSANRLADDQLTGERKDSYPVSRVNKSNKNKSNKNDSIGAKPTRQPNPLFDAIVQVCQIDPSINGNGSSVGKVCSALAGAEPPYTPAEVLAWGKTQSWRNTPPTIWQLRSGIGSIRMVKQEKSRFDGLMEYLQDNQP